MSKIILSIHDGHNASAAIFIDGVVKFAVSEERLNRKKFYWGWPTLSIAKALEGSGVTLSDVDTVCVSHLSFKDYLIRKLKKFQTFNFLQPKHMLGTWLNIWRSFKRDREIRKLVKKTKGEVFFCDHHLAHAASAYYFSGFQDALVVTADALGDSISHTAWEVSKGVWNKLVSGDGSESLGEFYAAITEGLGFTPNRHEGKVVGLAALAKPEVLKDKLQGKFIEIQDDYLHFKRMPYKKMVEQVRVLLKDGYTREEISAYGQNHLEDLMLKHINKLCTLTQHKQLAVAGGVFANVKMNQRITESTPVEKIFVQPAMGDEGLILGSATYYLYQKKWRLNPPLHDVFWGNVYTNEFIVEVLKNTQFNVTTISSLKEVAQMISEGVIVGLFDGHMEFGPRALGNRSIVADPRNSDVNKILNQRLKRSEFMPFAPSVLSDFASDIFVDHAHSDHTAQFMTTTFNVKDVWKKKVPAITHVDGTARPQLISKEVSPNYYAIVNEFYVLTGIPLVMNTSFNIHEEPIVSSPQDALRSLESGAVDCILFNNTILVTRK